MKFKITFCILFILFYLFYLIIEEINCIEYEYVNIKFRKNSILQKSNGCLNSLNLLDIKKNQILFFYKNEIDSKEDLENIMELIKYSPAPHNFHLLKKYEDKNLRTDLEDLTKK